MNSDKMLLNVTESIPVKSYKKGLYFLWQRHQKSFPKAKKVVFTIACPI